MKKLDLLFLFLLVPVDFVMLTLAGLAAYWLRAYTAIAGTDPVIFSLSGFVLVLVLVALMWIIVFALSGLYEPSVRARRLLFQLSRIFLAVSTGTMAIIAYIFFQQELYFSSRFMVLAGWILATIFVFFGRAVLTTVRRHVVAGKGGIYRTVIIGKNTTSATMVSAFESNPAMGYKVVAVLGADMAADVLLVRLDEIKTQQGIDELLQCDPNIDKNKNVDILDYCDEHKIVYKYTPDIFETQATNIGMATVAGTPVIELKDTPLEGWGRIEKRTLDIVGSSLLIALFSPVMLITAIAIKLDSKGPVFFKEKRVGRLGKHFHYFKFRSMCDHADKLRDDPDFLKKVEDLRQGSPMMKFKDDPRVTRVGKIIRKYSIDELAEFFLVFKGDMSLVGPRPHQPREVEKYQKHHKKVLILKPGITGLAQVSGRSDLDFEEEVKLDTYYIENWSLLVDIILVLRTPLVLLKTRRAGD